MAVHTGKDCVVKHGGTPVTLGQTTSFTLDDGIALAESTVMGTGNVARTATLGDWSASIDVLTDRAEAGQSPIVKGLAADFEFYTEGEGSGRTKHSGPGIVESISYSAEVAGLVTATITVQGNGDPGLTETAIV